MTAGRLSALSQGTGVERIISQPSFFPQSRDGQAKQGYLSLEKLLHTDPGECSAASLRPQFPVKLMQAVCLPIGLLFSFMPGSASAVETVFTNIYAAVSTKVHTVTWSIDGIDDANIPFVESSTYGGTVTYSAPIRPYESIKLTASVQTGEPIGDPAYLPFQRTLRIDSYGAFSREPT